MTAGESVERHALEAADELILEYQRTMEEAAQSGALGPEELERYSSTVRQAAAQVSDEVLPWIDSDSANEIYRHLVAMLTLDRTQYEVLDAADQYLVDLEAIRHVLRDLLQEEQPQALRRSEREIISLLETWLADVGVADIAALLGLSVRQLQRRRHEEGPATSREQLVARLVAILRHSWTDAGVIAWFRRPRPDLGGHAPLDLLGDSDCERAILIAARSGRVQGGV